MSEHDQIRTDADLDDRGLVRCAAGGRALRCCSMEPSTPGAFSAAVERIERRGLEGWG